MAAVDSQSFEKRNKKTNLTASSSSPPKRRRRHTKACSRCQVRKARCDIVKAGDPCKNYYSDNVACDRKTFKKKENAEKVLPAFSTSNTDTPAAVKSHAATSKECVNLVGGSNQPGSVFAQRHDTVQKTNRQSPYSSRISPGSIRVDVPATGRIFPDNLVGSGSPAYPTEELPSFIRPLSNSVSGENLEYLRKQDTLVLPESWLRTELLRCFIQYVYGYLSIVQLSDLLRIADDDDTLLEPISLLLFQSIIFAAAAFIDLRYLERAGFQNRKAARETFFQRAKLLYDFDCESNNTSCMQALLLMTYWNDTPDKEEDTWHWMTVSLSLANKLSLHQNPENLGHISMKEQRLRKRIWWSCFMCDHLIALGMRRLTRIKNGDFNVPMLTMEDFEKPLQLSAIGGALESCCFLQSNRHMAQMSRLCIEKVKLCLLVGRVLDVQYSPRYRTEGQQVSLVPKTHAAEARETLQCDQELQNWLNQLPDDVRYLNHAAISFKCPDLVTFLHQALLKMIYHATSITLHRPQLIPTFTQSTAPGIQYLTRSKVVDAATEVINIVNDLHKQKLSRFLPTSGVTALVPAIAVHLLCIKSKNSITRETSLRRFRQGMEVLHRLREMYISAEVANSFLDAAVRKTQIPVLRALSIPAEVELLQQESELSEDAIRSVLSNATLNSDEASMLLKLSAEPQLAMSQELKSSDIGLVPLSNFTPGDGDTNDLQAAAKLDNVVPVDIDPQSGLDTQDELHGGHADKDDFINAAFEDTSEEFNDIYPNPNEDWSLFMDIDQEIRDFLSYIANI